MDAVPDVGFVSQYVLDAGQCPVVSAFLRLTGICAGKSAVSLVLEPPRMGDFLSLQNADDLCRAIPMQGEVEDFLNDPPCFRVNQQMTLLIRVFDVPNRRIGSHVQAVGELRLESSSDLLAGLSCLHFIEDVEKRGHLTFTLRRVNIVVDGDVANAFAGKVDFCVLPRQDVVASKTGKVFRDDAVDLAVLNVLNHSLERGTVEVGAGIAIVNVLVDDHHALLLGVAAKHEPLRQNGGTVPLQFVIAAEPHIECCIVRLFQCLSSLLVKQPTLTQYLHSNYSISVGLYPVFQDDFSVFPSVMAGTLRPARWITSVNKVS